MLAGLPVQDRLVVELAQCLRMAGLDDTAGTLEEACADKRSIVALTSSDRKQFSTRSRIARTGFRSSAASCSSSANGDGRKRSSGTRPSQAESPPRLAPSR